MILDARLLPVAVAFVAGVLFVPGLYVWLALLVPMFVAGCLYSDRPVAAATTLMALGYLPCALLLAVLGVSWFTNGWFGYLPLRFNLSPATLLLVGDLVVELFYTWGWAVVAAYMGAGVILRRRIRAAA